MPVTTVKVVLLGDVAVGKTSIRSRFITDEFHEHEVSTTGAAFQRKLVEYEGKQIQFNIWDTAGQEKFKSISAAYTRNADVALLILDITRRETLEAVNYWRQRLMDEGVEAMCCLIGNKADLPGRKLTTDELKLAAGDMNAQYFECSAATGAGIKDLFDAVVKKMGQKGADVTPAGLQPLNMQEINAAGAGGKKGCC